MGQGKRLLFSGIIASAALALAPATATATDWSEDFESYAAGGGVLGNNNWTTWDGSAAIDGTVVTTPARDAQSLETADGDDVVALLSDLGNPADTGTWEISAYQYIPSGDNGAADDNSYFIIMNRFAIPCDPCSWALQLEMNRITNTLALTEPRIEPPVTLPLVRDAWAEFRVVIDLDKNLQHVYYDGAPLALAIPYAPAGTPVGPCKSVATDW